MLQTLFHIYTGSAALTLIFVFLAKEDLKDAVRQVDDHFSPHIQFSPYLYFLLMTFLPIINTIAAALFLFIIISGGAKFKFNIKRKK